MVSVARVMIHRVNTGIIVVSGKEDRRCSRRTVFDSFAFLVISASPVIEATSDSKSAYRQ